MKFGQVLTDSVLLMMVAGAANMAPVFLAKLPFANWPIDFGLKLSGVRIFGDHKTVKGFMGGVLAAALFNYFILQGGLLLGAVIGFGALVGDATKSFLKRRVNIPPGVSWFPYDQVDWVLGYLFIATLVLDVSVEVYILSLILGLGLHVLFKWLGFLLKLNGDWI